VGITDGISTNLIPIVLMTGVENGWVCDVKLAKNIILAHFSTMRYYSSPVYGDKSMDDWLDKVKNNLQSFDGDFSIMREKGWFLGGPDGWSGFIICTLDTWLEEMDPNEEVLSVCEVDGKPTVFVLHESD
jgi:hypothetical protein